jgi:hypothetical protein
MGLTWRPTLRARPCYFIVDSPSAPLYFAICRARALHFPLQSLCLDSCHVLACRVKIGSRIRLAKMHGGQSLWSAGPSLPTWQISPAPPTFFWIIFSIPAPRPGQRLAVLTSQGLLSSFQACHLSVQSPFGGQRVDLLLECWFFMTNIAASWKPRWVKMDGGTMDEVVISPQRSKGTTVGDVLPKLYKVTFFNSLFNNAPTKFFSSTLLVTVD